MKLKEAVLKFINDKLLYGNVAKIVRTIISVVLAKAATVKVIAAVPCLGACISGCSNDPELIKYLSDILMASLIYPSMTALLRKVVPK